MNISERIAAFTFLGDLLTEYLSDPELKGGDKTFAELHQAVNKSFHHNGWFDKSQVLNSLQGILEFLSAQELEKWIQHYHRGFDQPSDLSVGIIMAGNIPLVGFHDLLSVMMAGFRARVKMSSDDKLLLPALLNLISSKYPDLVSRIELVQRLENYDAVIATGSDNTARYFKSYFGKVPHIIRKNRTSIAILTGDEDETELKQLGQDIFEYYGLGCRNVSKIYVPQDFELSKLYESILSFDWVMLNKKYMNNHAYHRTLYLMNNESILDNEFLILKEDKGLHSPLSVLFVERYTDFGELKSEITKLEEDIQCIVGKGFIPFGKAQCPALDDYADGVNTLDFLADLQASAK